MEKMAKKNKSPKKPRGRQPAGAVLVDGKWQMTELAARMAAERMLRAREYARRRHRKTRELLRMARPELFLSKGMDPKQTTLVPRSTEREVVRAPRQKTDANIAACYDAFWRSVQRDEGVSYLSSGAATSTNPACIRKSDGE